MAMSVNSERGTVVLVACRQSGCREGDETGDQGGFGREGFGREGFGRGGFGREGFGRVVNLLNRQEPTV